jgi:hypothetical protein
LLSFQGSQKHISVHQKHASEHQRTPAVKPSFFHKFLSDKHLTANCTDYADNLRHKKQYSV